MVSLDELVFLSSGIAYAMWDEPWSSLCDPLFWCIRIDFVAHWVLLGLMDTEPGVGMES